MPKYVFYVPHILVYNLIFIIMFVQIDVFIRMIHFKHLKMGFVPETCIVFFNLFLTSLGSKA